MTAATDFCNVLYRLADERNGEDVALTLSGVPMLVLQNADSAQQVLRVNAGNYEKHMPWFRQALGPSRMTENGADWRFRQQVSQSYLARFDRQQTFERCVRHATVTVGQLIASGTAGEVRIDDNLFREMAASVMLESFFGRSLEEAGVDIADIARMIAFGSEYAFMPEQGRSPFEPDILRAFLKVRAKVLGDLASFRTGATEEGSLLARLRDLSDTPGNGFVLEHELALFFAAGAETTAASMGWACHLMARHPDIQDRLQRAVDTFWASTEPGWSELAKVTELENFTGEVLRIFPPTPVIGRRALGSDDVGAHRIDAGDQILISMVGVQHDRRLRPNPWQVDLDGPASREANVGQSFSFSVGPRVCGGARFAVVEMMSFLAVFLRLARFEPTSFDAPQFRWQSQLLHEGGQPVRAVARRPS